MKPMIKELPVGELSQEVFSPYGSVLDAGGMEPKMREDVFTFWDGLAEMEARGKLTVALLEVVKRPPEFSKLERHVKTEEVFFAIDGPVIVLVGTPTPGRDLPKPDTVKAFRLEPGKGVHLKVGAWHWILFPLQPRARLLVLFRKGTPDEDLEIKDLHETGGITFKIQV